MRATLVEFINRLTAEHGLVFTRFLLKKVLNLPLKNSPNEGTLLDFIEVILHKFEGPSLEGIFGGFVWTKASQEFSKVRGEYIAPATFGNISSEWRKIHQYHLSDFSSKPGTVKAGTVKVGRRPNNFTVRYYDQAGVPITSEFMKEALKNYITVGKKKHLSEDIIKKYPLQKK